MKRNETVLVYAVTGLLLVILLVAVVFGEQNPAKVPDGGRVRPKVASLPGVTPAEAPPEPVIAGDETQADRETPASTGPKGDPSATPTIDPQAEAKGGAPNGPEASAAGGETGGVALNSSVVTPAKQLEGALGASTRSGDYRLVPAMPGDTLARLVDRWCAAAAHLATVEVLNENLVDGHLTAGQEVVVPWVADETLLAAHRIRAEQAALAEKAKGEIYTLKRGDSLWKVAKARVAKNLIPAWLERFKQLNPAITDPSVLIAGQKVRLPH